MHKVIHKKGTLKLHSALRDAGFGKEEIVIGSLCEGAKGLYKGRSYFLSRLWKNVTCKNCLRRKPK